MKRKRVIRHTLAYEESLFRYLMRELAKDFAKLIDRGLLSKEAFDAFNGINHTTKTTTMILIWSANPPIDNVTSSTASSFEEVTTATGLVLTEQDRKTLTNGGKIERTHNNTLITVKNQKGKTRPRKSGKTTAKD